VTARSLRAWAWAHQWSSLVCTLFFLMLCLTGLPLIFHEEIEHLTGAEVEAPPLPAGTLPASLDRVVATAQALHPTQQVQYLYRDPDETAVWRVYLGETVDSDPWQNEEVVVDARTAQVLAEPKSNEGFIYLMFKAHTELFAGLPGKLFLGLMGLLLVVALVSGVVLYAPFMRTLDFGTVRRDRSARLQWLDLHNVLGIVTLVWALVVGVTGVINTWVDVLLKVWQADQMAEMVAPYQGQPRPDRLGSLEASVQAATAQEPRMRPAFLTYPGSRYSSPHHYAIYMRGTTPLTSRLFKPVLVDAQTATVTDSRPLPWYLTAVLVSQPLHFGDFGGLPLQILWALLDVLTIAVLWTGLVLWWRRRKHPLDVTLRSEPL
jgi:uncharacterized iron-regulated membrane protein